MIYFMRPALDVQWYRTTPAIYSMIMQYPEDWHGWELACVE